MVRILKNIILFIICVVFMTCKSLDRNNNYQNDNSIGVNIYSKIDTNAIYKKVSVEYYNVTGQLNCEFIKFKPNYKVEVYPCNIQRRKKEINKNNGVFYLINQDKIGVKYTVNTWHGKQKYNDTLLILNDSLIKIKNSTVPKAFIKEVYIKILDMEK